MADHQMPANESEVYKQYQKNVRLSETLQEEMLQGVRRGEDPCILLMKAAKVISLMTGDNNLFSSEVQKGLQAVYGMALDQKAPLEDALAAAKQRLENIVRTEQNTPEGEDKKRMNSAIREHQALIERLEEQISKG